MSKALKAEIEYRLSIGCRLVSVREMDRQFRALGYTLDRRFDCRAISRYLDDGRCYPACTTDVREIEECRPFISKHAGTATSSPCSNYAWTYSQ